MIIVFVVLTLLISVVSAAWSAIDQKEKTFVMKALAKGSFYASIATGILFVFVTLF
jgi:hypothetical protein